MKANLIKLSAGLVAFYLIIKNPTGSAEFINGVFSSLARFSSALG